MMDPSKKDNFEDQWKRAFDEASVTPPASAWEAIEARLDQDENNKIVPLWWRSPKLWYAAASVAALLLVGGLWFSNKNALDYSVKTHIATNSIQPDKKADSSGKSSVAEKQGETLNKENDVARIASSETKSQKSSESDRPDKVGDKPKRTLLANEKSSKPKGIKSGKASETEIAFNKPGATKNKRSEAGSKDSQADNVPIDVTQSQELPAVGSEATGNIASAAVETGNLAIVTPDMVAGKSYQELDVFLQKRYVFFKQQDDIVEPAAKKHTEYWAGVGLMPASFNPDVNLKTSPATFAQQSFSKQKSVIGKSEAGASYAFQSQGGMRLSKHWSLETGISYLQGNSSYAGGGYLLNAATNGSANVLESALADAYYGNKGITTPALSAANNLYIDVNKQVRNDYRYLQVPVQTGFTLNPDGKLSYSVLGGMMANFFLGNELESGNGDVIKTTASDDVYRSMNWAATTGLRFNYKLSSKWRATLTGSYQKSITSGVRSNQSLDTHPYLYGVSWGMRYSF